MSYAGQVTLSRRQEGSLLIRRRSRATRSYGNYQPKEGDFAPSFRAVLERWQSETAFASSPEEITGHTSFKALVDNARVIAPLILHELRKGASLLVWVMDDAFPGERPYPENVVGNIEQMTKAWLAWGEQHGRSL